MLYETSNEINIAMRLTDMDDKVEYDLCIFLVLVEQIIIDAMPQQALASAVHNERLMKLLLVYRFSLQVPGMVVGVRSENTTEEHIALDDAMDWVCLSKARINLVSDMNVCLLRKSLKLQKWISTINEFVGKCCFSTRDVFEGPLEIRQQYYILLLDVKFSLRVFVFQGDEIRKGFVFSLPGAHVGLSKREIEMLDDCFKYENRRAVMRSVCWFYISQGRDDLVK